jgi:hypothetical protein
MHKCACRGRLYSAPVARLLACPFCRQLFPEDEGTRCPECALALAPLEKLPLSHEAEADAMAELLRVHPDDRPRRFWDFSRGRGLLLAVAIAGLFAFFMPWVEMTRPELVTLSAYDLARGRAGWLWGGATGYFIMIPLVLTRDTVHRLRGVRVICATFSAMTLLEVAMIVLRPPAADGYAFSWGWGLYLSGALSAVGVLVAARLGGPRTATPSEPAPESKPESKQNRVLH